MMMRSVRERHVISTNAGGGTLALQPSFVQPSQIFFQHRSRCRVCLYEQHVGGTQHERTDSAESRSPLQGRQRFFFQPVKLVHGIQ